MPHKLGFCVAQASSEDEGGRAKELLQQGPSVKGWVSSRFCLYPQELIFQLRERCHLSKVQILAHQHLIPEKVELHIGDVKPGKDTTLYNAKFALLGYVSLSDNEHSQFKARELKSVTVECTGTFLKLLLHKNHVNRINLYNQVGLVAVNLLGNELETNNNSVSPDGEGGQVPGGDPQAVPLYHDLAFAMYVDTQVAATIRTLEDRRAAAIREKRLEYANKLKAAVSQLRTAGERLGKYEIEKRHAVDTENYDRAKVKKELAEEYREQVYKALEIDDLLERKGKLDKNDYRDTKGPRELPAPPRQRALKPRDNSPSPIAPSHLPPPRLTSTPPKPPPTPPKSPSPPPIKIPSAPLPDLRPPYLQPNTPRLPASPGRPYLSTPPAAPSPASYTSPPSAYSSPYYSYDERALPALKHRDPLALAEEDGEAVGGSRGRLHFLSEADKKDAALPLDVFGRDLVEKIYSKNYSEKEAGLKQLQQQLANYTQDSGVRPDRYVRGCVVLVRRALRDKVYSVGALAADTLSHILCHFIAKHKVTKKELTTTLDKVLPDLLAKTADNASRNQSLASAAILEMLSLSLDRGLGGVGVEVTRPLTNTVHPRGALCRASIVEEQINALGITSLPKDKDSGFTVRHLVEFAHSAFKHQNNEVRKVGERLLLALYSHYPSTVRKVLPQQDDIARKNVLYRNLFEQLEALDEKREAASSQSRASPPRASVAAAAVSVTPPLHSSSSSCSSSGVSTGGSSVGHDPPYASLDLPYGGHDPHSDPPAGMGCIGGLPQISITPDEAEVRGRALSRLNGSRLDLTSMEGGDLSPLDPEDKTCIFCGAFDKSFTDTGLDMHYWRACPVLTRCNHCRQVVEVASLTHHLLGECVSFSEYRRCERCGEAITKKTFHTHALAKSCIPCKPEPGANHCPLCHHNIAPWDDGWRLHLMPGPNSCPNNLRVWQQVSKKVSNEKSPSVASGGSVGGGGGSSGGGSSGGAGVKPRIPGTVTPGTPRKNLNRRR